MLNDTSTKVSTGISTSLKALLWVSIVVVWSIIFVQDNWLGRLTGFIPVLYTMGKCLAYLLFVIPWIILDHITDKQ